MIVTLPSGKEIECEVEMDGYKVADVYTEDGVSVIYDGLAELGMTQEQVDAVYRQAEQDWCDRQADRADWMRKAEKEDGLLRHLADQEDAASSSEDD